MKNVDWKQLEADFPEFRWDPSVVSVGSIDDPDPAIAYWRTKTPQERLRALEFLRRIAYGYNQDPDEVPTLAEATHR